MNDRARSRGRSHVLTVATLIVSLLAAAATGATAQSPPQAIAVANPQTGMAPLTVAFSGSGTDADGVVVLYEWDFDGDGVYDFASNTGPSVTYTYGAVGTFNAVLRVTDNDGLTGTDTLTISPAGSATEPPGASLSVIPSSGDVSTIFTFTLTGVKGLTMGNIDMVLLEIDFEGDGKFDWSQAFPPGSGSPAIATVTHIYGVAGTYSPVVRATDQFLLSAKAALVTPVTVTSPTNLKVWMSAPKDGDSIWGNAVTLHANTAPGNLTARVKFQYRIQGNPTWIDIGGWIVPPPFSFSTTWDVTGFPDPTTVEVRAIAEDTAPTPNTVASSFVTLVITDATTIREFVLSDGAHEKTQRISRRMTERVFLPGPMDVIFPYGALEQDAVVTVRTVPASSETPPSGVQWAGPLLDVSIAGNPTLRSLAEVRFGYSDTNGDGFVDGTAVAVSGLRLYRKSGGAWKPLPRQQVLTQANEVRGSTIEFSPLGLGGDAPTGGTGGGGGGGCGVLGARESGRAAVLFCLALLGVHALRRSWSS